MDNWFQSKWFVRIISLAFAILLYVFVTIEVEVDDPEDNNPIFSGTQKEVELVEGMPVNVKVDSDKYVVSGVPEEVDVSLEGAVSILTPVVRQKNFNLFVDLTEYEEGTHTVEIEHENIPKELSAYIEPKEIDVTIEERATGTHRIEVEFINEDLLPKDYEVKQPELNVDEVTIVSSKAMLEEISLVKVFIDVSDEKESIKNRELPVNVYDSQGKKLQVSVRPETVVVSVEIERPSKEVNIEIPTIGELPDGLTLKSLTPEVENIKIYGKEAEIEKIDKLISKPVDLSEVTESKEVTVDIETPEEIVISQKKLKVNVELDE